MKNLSIILVTLAIALVFGLGTLNMNTQGAYYSEHGFVPGVVIVGLKEPYLGDNPALDLFPEFDIVEVEDFYRTHYEAIKDRPGIIPERLEETRKKIGTVFVIKLVDESEEAVWNAISTLEQKPIVSYAEVNWISAPAIPTITFNPGSGSVFPTSVQTDTDGKLSDLPTPTRDGYAFKGWFTAAEGGTKVDLSTIFDADTILYAQWSLDVPRTGVAGITEAVIAMFALLTASAMLATWCYALRRRQERRNEKVCNSRAVGRKRT